MTLTDALIAYGLYSGTGRKVLCLGHKDTNPSALLNEESDTVYCFVCRKLYTADWYERRLGVHIDRGGGVTEHGRNRLSRTPLFIEV